MSQPLKIAIMAMGGEGGGVLADWIVDLGETNGYFAQTTSVPGVAQRTGATIYYVELYPQRQAELDGGVPVLALMPLPGDVDVVLASELMECGRAVQRGLVTPERTTLIASTHRVYSIAEKSAMGDGRADSAALVAHALAAAKRFVRFDMAEAAERSGSVLSAVLFGALAGAGVLPFARAQFEATITRGGVGVSNSLKAFADAFARVAQPESGAGQAGLAVVPSPAASIASERPAQDVRVRALLTRVDADFAPWARTTLREGVRRLIDYQDLAYAGLYLDRLAAVAALPGAADGPVLEETARHLALWMSYEDTMRVAALKTRGSRFERVRGEVRADAAQVLAIDEYLHPRVQEIAETVPAWLGRRIERPGALRRVLERFTQKGRVVTTSSLSGFLMLYAVAGMKRWRRSTTRFAAENAAIVAWLASIAETARHNPQLAVEVARCQRLVKGYSDTHERGMHNFERLMAAVRRAGATLAPATLADLREAALADEQGAKLEATLARHALA
jgi:indolepyruvate ferredoxin oxidoreductase, beta subunit